MNETHNPTIGHALRYILGNCPDTLAIFVKDTPPGPAGEGSTGLKFLVLHSGPYSQRTRVHFNGIACEFWFDTPGQTKAYMGLGREDRGCDLADIIATGRMIHGDGCPEIMDLVRQAKKVATAHQALWARKKKAKAGELLALLDDLGEVSPTDGLLAQYLLQVLVSKGIEYALAGRGRPLPAFRDRLQVLQVQHAEVGKMVQTIFHDEDLRMNIHRSKKLIGLLLDKDNRGNEGG